MRILLLGANGQLGCELARTLPDVGEVKACGRAEVDLTDRHAIIKAIEACKPDIIVNAAAYTAADKAEGERELAFKVNANAVGVLAEEAAKRHVAFIHYSTDYVFDGTLVGSYTEDHSPNPINVYGESKLAGEQKIIASGCYHLLFRIAWVIGQHGDNFAKTILHLAMERDKLGVVNDQYGVPTSIKLITKVTNDAINALKKGACWPAGIYHLVPRGETTWFGIAQVLLQVASEAGVTLAMDPNNLKAITTAEYPSVAKRPVNSRLNTDKLHQQLSFDLPHWQTDFVATAKDIIEEYKIA